jgi:hypothetical protein
MKEGDFLVCKRTCYDFRDAIYPNKEHPKENIPSFMEKINNKFFRTPIYKKGKKYKIEFIYNKVCSISRFNNDYVIIILYRIGNEDFSESILSNTFMTPKEIRKLKLQKIAKYRN